MSYSDEFRNFLIEHLAGFGPVTVRRMFGGGGIYRDGLMFGIIQDETIYLKADADSRPRFDAEGSVPFVYQSDKGKKVALNYFRVPERCMDDPAEMVEWALLGYGAALRAAAGKAPGKKSKVRRRASGQS